MPAPLLHITAYGRPALAALHARVAAAKAADPLRPVTVVVPTNSVGVAARRALAGGELGPITPRGNGVAGLTIVTVYRLAELLGAARLAGAGQRPVSTPLVAAAVRTVLAEDPGLFAEVAQHPSTEEALVRAYRELSELAPEHLDALARTSPRAADVVRIRRATRARLAAWYEEADLMAAAVEAVRQREPVLDDLGTVLVHLPQALSRPAADLLRALAEATAVEVIAGRTGSPQADADVDESLRRLGLDPGATAIPRATPAGSTVVVSVSDAEEEARSAVALVLDAARDRVPLERVAILYPDERPYGRLVAEALDAAGVPWNGRGVRPLTDRLLGRWLLDLLALDDERWSRPAVLGLLTAVPVRDDDGGRVPAVSWERASREAGVVAGADQWVPRLTRLAEELERLATAEESVRPGGNQGQGPRQNLIRRWRREAAGARSLGRHVARLAADFQRVSGRCRWDELAAWCRELADRHLGDEQVRAQWPEEERRAAEKVEEALDRLAGLAGVEPATDLRTFRRALEAELESDLGRRGALGRGVLVGPVSAALGVQLDLVVVLGLAEGVLPARPREDSLLPDSERAAASGHLRLRSQQVGVQQRHLLAALASADRRVLLFPRGDLRRSVENAPSRWLLDVVAELRGDGQRRLPEQAPWLIEVPSFAARVRRADRPATRQEYGLRVLADAPSGPELLDHPLVAADPPLRLGAELALTRGRGFSRFDGNLSALADRLPPLTDNVLSASRIETWLACPHTYLIAYVLGIQPVENPEELLRMQALDKGSLFHDVLERWLRAEIERGVPAPDEPWSPEARARLLELGEAACDDAEARGQTGHPLLWRHDRRRILAELERFLAEDDRRRAKLGLTPIAAERPFGLLHTDTQPATIPLGDGRSIRVRGQIDRLDRATDGTLLVTDYKTGGLSRFRGIGDDTPLGADGLKLQLPIYALAMRQAEPGSPRIRAEYWFTSTKGDFKAIGCDLTDAVEAELRRALVVAADGIAAGHFPLRPPEPRWMPWVECVYCDPDGLGTADRYREWERVREAPELAAYVGYLNRETAEVEA